MKSIQYSSWFLSVVFLIGTATVSFAGEPDFIRQSIRARGMGNAQTAVANDEMLLYYNPAGLRSLTHNLYELYSFNATTNEDTINLATEDDSVAALGDITGSKIYIESTLLSTSHHNTRWGIAAFGNIVLDLAVHNPIVPYFGIRAFAQAGVLGGIAFSFMDHQLDVGFGFKGVNRSGVVDDLHITDEAIIEAIESDGEETDKLEDKYSSVTAYSSDVGIIYHIDSKYNLYPKLAVVAKNIGGMEFDKAGSVPMTIDLGFSTESELQSFDITCAIDYLDLTNANDIASDAFTIRNLKMGVEVGWEKMYNGHHFVSFRIGRNGPYDTYGLSLNPAWTLLYLIPKIDVVFWSQEIGEFAGDREDKRTTVQLSYMF